MWSMEEVVNRSWFATVREHWVFLVLFLITGPLTILYACVSFGYWIMNRGQGATSIDAFRMGVLWLVYGLVMLYLIG